MKFFYSGVYDVSVCVWVFVSQRIGCFVARFVFHDTFYDNNDNDTSDTAIFELLRNTRKSINKRIHLCTWIDGANLNLAIFHCAPVRETWEKII